MATTRQWALVVEAGKALYGPTWPRDLPKALEIDEPEDGSWELARWAKGAPIPKGVLDDLLRLVTIRAEALQRVFVELKREIADARWRAMPPTPGRRGLWR